MSMQQMIAAEEREKEIVELLEGFSNLKDRIEAMSDDAPLLVPRQVKNRYRKKEKSYVTELQAAREHVARLESVMEVFCEEDGVFDLGKMEKEVCEVGQEVFNNVANLLILAEPDRTLDRFRGMSPQHRLALFNLEKDALEAKMKSEAARSQGVLLEKVHGLEEEVKSLSADFQCWQAKVEDERKNGMRMEEQQKELSALWQKQSETLKSSEMRVSKLQAKLGGLKAEIDDLKSTVRDQDNHLAHQRDNVVSLSADVERLRPFQLEADRLREELASLSADVDRLKPFEPEVERLREEVASLSADVDRLKPFQLEADRLKEEVASLSADVDRLKPSELEVERLQKEVARLEPIAAKVNGLIARSNEKDVELQMVHGQLRSTKNDRDRVELELTDALERVAGLKADAAEFQRTKDGLKAEAGNLRTELQKTKEESGELARRLNVEAEATLGEAMNLYERLNAVTEFLLQGRRSTMPIQAWLEVVGSQTLGGWVDGGALDASARPWRMLNWWCEGDGAVEPTHIKGLVDLVEEIYCVTQKAGGDDTTDQRICSLVRLLATEIAGSRELPLSAILFLMNRAVETLQANSENRIGVQLCLVGIWQIARSLQRRWPQNGGVGELVARVRIDMADHGESVSDIAMLLDGDNGKAFEEWMRGGDLDDVPSGVLEVLERSAKLCVPKDDAIFLFKSSRGKHVFIFDLASHTIRVASKSRAHWVSSRCLSLVASVEDEDDILLDISDRLVRQWVWQHIEN